ncbi:MAG TPA: LLM class F420-dependent oxidoreductase, partial [Candidatus Tectomicrobia bacterium]|nr:LLM class F420-dependent oxidoreductase [Candidatus Tectomicrobia bacterium]
EEAMMRIGFVLPNVGPAATPDTIVEAARRAEAIGYDSLWVTERLLYPVTPRTPYPASPDGVLPPAYRHVLDPLETLTFAAAHTRRVALGTSVLDMLFYTPVVLARRLTTLDVLSGGRLRVGLGLGWSRDEFEAVGVPMDDRGARADEFLAALKAIWTTDPVDFQGRYYRIPRSVIGPRPVQKPHPPIYLAAFVPRALRRAATVADGWNPTGIPADAMATMLADLRRMVRDAGRAVEAWATVVRANVHVTDGPLGASRAPFHGSVSELRDDVARVRDLGVDEVFFDPTFSPAVGSPAAFLDAMERLRDLARDSSSTG